MANIDLNLEVAIKFAGVFGQITIISVQLATAVPQDRCTVSVVLQRF